ncbi:MAG TPA: N-acyl homoserine lactonase family protein [Myxococcales bacterium]|jgi:N-acyl homoserine lactone hydrolase|nr:N-acyl homoserine lactonase family protein [Myxococcales bacterium]
MQKTLCSLSAAAVFMALPAFAQGPAEVTLTRLDCGTGAKPVKIAERFTDTFAYSPDKELPFTYSCYVIRHGDDVMVWDTGFPPGENANAPKTSLTDQLAQLKITPDQVKFVGISHYHADHTSQLPSLPNAMLLIGKGDWDAITAPKPAQGVNAKAFTHWISEGGKVEPLALDKDVFGDGTVIVLRTPGHTPGHSSLLVRLKHKGSVILTGDAVHFHENYQSDGVPAFNYDRAETLASLERIKKIAANQKAMVIIQHDPRDIKKLPAFPAAAN